MYAKYYCLLLLLSTTLQQCKDKSLWQESTLKEQTAYSGAIIEATVKGLTEWNNTEAITVTVHKYHKGCGPAEVIVRGFVGNIKCGISASSIGTRALFFVCAANDKEEFILNSYTDFTGSLNANTDNISELQKATVDEYKCVQGGFLYKGCKNRPNELVNEFADRQSEVRMTPFTYNPKTTQYNQSRENVIWGSDVSRARNTSEQFNSYSSANVSSEYSAYDYGSQGNVPYYYSNPAPNSNSNEDNRFDPYSN